MAHPSPLQALPTTPMEAALMVAAAMVTLECTMMTLLELELTLEPMETMATEARVAMEELLVCKSLRSALLALCLHRHLSESQASRTAQAGPGWILFTIALGIICPS